MSPGSKFLKCTLSVILYIVVYISLLKLKSIYWIHQSDSVLFVINDQTKAESSVEFKNITKAIHVKIKLLERDEMNEQFINLQESATILRQISNVCEKYNLKTPLTKRHFLYNSKHKSMYCWIRKVASTSFTKLFSDMKNRQVTRNYYREVDILSPKTTKELQLVANETKVFKLLVVRHPFQRLVSSYRDRIEDNSKHTAQAWIYTKKIFHLTRPKLFHSNTSTGNFQKKVFTANKRLKVIPSFKEFSEWLLQNSEEDDVHWDRYYTHCAVCNVRYNYILKLDNYTYGEINYIFSKFGLDKDRLYLANLEKTRGGYTNFHTTCKYFANLTQDIIFRLYKRYKLDFEMFDYDLKRYLFCVNKET